MDQYDRQVLLSWIIMIDKYIVMDHYDRQVLLSWISMIDKYYCHGSL